jgi:preprotein translocase subunit SecG
MNVLYYLTMVLHVSSCLFLIGVVLLQQGKGQDLASAFGGGGTQTAFGPRGSANVLSRATTILAALFMVTSLTLSLLKVRSRSVLDKVQAPVSATSPAPVAPASKLPAPAASTAAPASSQAPAPAGSAAPSPAAQ